METHEGIRMGSGLTRRARLVTAATALVSALALTVPGVAGAGLFGTRSYSQPVSTATTAPISLTITQNTAMVVDVSGTSTTATGAVSWSDVSWSDSLLVD
jgi:hypothetical protein